MQLHLIRHGKTRQDSETGNDFDRQLLPKGMKQSLMLGQNLTFDPKTIVYCSSAKRTQETFGFFNQGQQLENVTLNKDLYLCSKDVMLDMIWNTTSNEDVLIVGHNFGISQLASYFTDEFIEMRTGEYIQITFDADHWNETSQGLGEITHRYRPSPAL